MSVKVEIVVKDGFRWDAEPVGRDNVFDSIDEAMDVINWLHENDPEYRDAILAVRVIGEDYPEPWTIIHPGEEA